MLSKIRFAAFCLGSLWLLSSPARADLGNCLIYRGNSPQLDGAAFDALSKQIYGAYEISLDSADDLIFLVELTPSVRPKGGYAISKLEVKFGGSWPLKGYRIIAHDVEGLKNGVAEIVQVFKDGRIYEVKQGDRKGPVKQPIYIETENKE